MQNVTCIYAKVRLSKGIIPCRNINSTDNCFKILSIVYEYILTKKHRHV